MTDPYRPSASAGRLPSPPDDVGPGAGFAVERVVARVLVVTTVLGVGLSAVGTALMLAKGISPLDRAPDGESVGGLGALAEPAVLIRLGIVALVAGPTLRVAAALPGYLVGRERLMAAVCVAILGVIALDVIVSALGA